LIFFIFWELFLLFDCFRLFGRALQQQHVDGMEKQNKQATLHAAAAHLNPRRRLSFLEVSSPFSRPVSASPCKATGCPWPS
jgi:hypothetical protein